MTEEKFNEHADKTLPAALMWLAKRGIDAAPVLEECRGKLAVVDGKLVAPIYEDGNFHIILFDFD